MATRSEYDTLTTEAFYLAISKQKLLIAQFDDYDIEYDPKVSMLRYRKCIEGFIFESYITLQVIKGYQGYEQDLKKDLDTRFSKAYSKFLLRNLSTAA